MENIHTATPWEIQITNPSKNYGRTIINSAGQSICNNGNSATGQELGNLQRIVACINACNGINPESVPDLLEALEWLTNEFKSSGWVTEHRINAAHAAIAKAKGTP